MEGEPRLLNPQTQSKDRECETPVDINFVEVCSWETAKAMPLENAHRSANKLCKCWNSTGFVMFMVDVLREYVASRRVTRDCDSSVTLDRG